MKNIKALLIIVSTMSLFALTACDNKSEPASESRAITTEKEVVAESETKVETEPETEQEAEMTPALAIVYQNETLDISNMTVLDWVTFRQKMKLPSKQWDVDKEMQPLESIKLWRSGSMAYNPYDKEIVLYEAKFLWFDLDDMQEYPDELYFLGGFVNKNSTIDEWNMALDELGFMPEDGIVENQWYAYNLQKSNGQNIRIIICCSEYEKIYKINSVSFDIDAYYERSK